MEPVEVACDVFCGDSSPGAQEGLEPFVSAVDGLDVEVAARSFALGEVDRLVADAQRLGAGRIDIVSVGDEQSVFGQVGFEFGLDGFGGHRIKYGCKGGSAAVYGDQDWSLRALR